jgi:hypothetical protein
VTTGGITQARQRLAHEPVKETSAQVATEDPPGAFLGAWLKVSMDGVEWDVPDTEANVAAFGVPGTAEGDGRAAFPKARAVTIGQCASHASLLAAIGPCVSKGSGEQSLASETRENPSASISRPPPTITATDQLSARAPSSDRLHRRSTDVH